MNDLSLHIIDIIQNSVSAGATRIVLEIGEDPVSDRLTLVVWDNGKGMSPDQLKKLDDPFFTTRTTRRVGMGIPLFRQSAEQSGGFLQVESQPGKGTRVTAVFGYSHIDRPPMGDFASSFILMVAANPEIAFELSYTYREKEYRFNTAEVNEALEGTPLNQPPVIRMLTEMVGENIRELKEEGAESETGE